MDNILAPIQEIFEGQIVSFPIPIPFHTAKIANLANLQDFHGQRIADILCTALLIVSGVSRSHSRSRNTSHLLIDFPSTEQIVASLVGFIFHDIFLSLWTGLAGLFLTALVVIPPWPVYNQHPEKWLVPLDESGVTILVDNDDGSKETKSKETKGA